VCVTQTCLDLLASRRQVFGGQNASLVPNTGELPPGTGTHARRRRSHRLDGDGAFELLGQAATEEFKRVLTLVR
jgi:hypothetical protein